MKKALLLLLLFIAALYLLPCIFRPLMSPDEFRYAEIPREMLETGDFVTPRLLGGRYFEKPPMGYWVTAASFKLFGFNAFALRLIPVLSALASAALLGWWCLKRSFRPETALNAAFLYLAGGMVWILGTFATLDSLFAMWTTGAMVFLGTALESRRPGEKLFLLTAAGVALGCGFLTQGFLAYVLPGISAAAYLLWQKRWKELFTLPWLPLLVSFLIAAPWAAAIHRAEPDFWNYFVMHEHFRRFTDSAPGQHGAPFWLLLPFWFAGLFPALFPVLAGAFQVRGEGWKALRQIPEMRYALCSLVLPLIFLSLSDGKLPTYVLPCFAPAAMMGALILDRADPEKRFLALRHLTTVSALLFIFAGTLVLLAELFYLLWGTGFIPTLPLKAALWAPLLTTAALGAGIAGTILFINRRLKVPEPAGYFTLFSITALVSVWFFPGFTANCKMPEYELLELAGQLSRKKILPPRLITLPKLMHATAWCCRDRTLQLLESLGEMKYGHKAALKHGERKIGLTYAEAEELVNAPTRKEDILIIFPENDFEEINQRLPGGEKFSTSGEIRALYFPGKLSKAKKK